MSLSILNNPASLAAQNELGITNSSLQSTLFQLSSGSRINSGADDAAGLAIADGLQANITALTQSARNANDGVGALQVADGALAQVTTLLNRAVTLATESATGTVGNGQRTALQAEYTAIQNEIDRIGSNTNYNGSQVFTSSPTQIYISDSSGNTTQLSNFISVNIGTLSSSALLGAGGAGGVLAANGAVTAGDNVTIGGTTYTFVSAATLAAAQSGATGAAVNVAIDGSTDPLTALQNTLSNLAAAINGGSGAGTAYQSGGGANADATASASGNTINLSATPNGQAVGAANIATTVGQGAEFNFLNGATFTAAAGTDLTTAADAQAALANINSAIQHVAGQRGALGATTNRLQSASNVINNQVQNLTAAEDGIRAADIPSTVAHLTKYSILEQTGIAALSQANQSQQLVLSLLK